MPFRMFQKRRTSVQTRTRWFATATMLTSAIFLAGCDVELKPFTQGELTIMASDRAARMTQAGQDPVADRIDLYEAMARALKYNLDIWVDRREEALRFGEKTLADYDMLPDLVASAEYFTRNNEPGGRSVNLVTGVPSTDPSRSTERSVGRGDLTLSWNILDFGMNFIRADQKGDEALIAMEQRRSTVNRVIEDVRSAYWRAVSAERLLGRLSALENRAQRALRESETLSTRGATAPMDALAYQRDLLLVLRSAQELKRDLSVAKSQLSALMNLPPATYFAVEIPRRTASMPAIRGSLDELLRTSYLNRPELREISYRQRINSREDELAVLAALPGISALLGINASTNDLLYNQDWVNIGARVTWDAINVARLPNRLRNVEAGDALLDARALALTRAVAVQVAVSVANYEALRRELATAARYQNVSAKILNETRARAQSGELGEQAQIKEEFEAILAEMRFDLAYAETQTAYANLYSSIGLNPYAPDVTGHESVADLAGSLRSLWQRRENVSAVAHTN